MKSQSRVGAWTAMIVGSLYFLIPLLATFEFSLRMKRGVYSFEAYSVVLSDPRFQASFGYSILMAVLTIIVGVLLVVPTAYYVQLRLPKLRPVVEFITLLPLVVPPDRAPAGATPELRDPRRPPGRSSRIYR